MMHVRFELDDRVSARLREMSSRELPEARREMVDRTLREALTETVRLNPVETGRSRAAWIAALVQAGGDAASDVRGTGTEAAAVAEGTALGSAERFEEESVSSAGGTSRVRYVKYLEYGTSRMAAFAMVRRALVSVQQRVGRLFRFPRE